MEFIIDENGKRIKLTKRQKEIQKRALARLEKGFNMGEYEFNREELYDRFK